MTYKVIRVTPEGREVAFLNEEPLLGLTEDAAEEAANRLSLRAAGADEDATFEVVEESESEEPVEVAVD